MIPAPIPDWAELIAWSDRIAEEASEWADRNRAVVDSISRGARHLYCYDPAEVEAELTRLQSALEAAEGERDQLKSVRAGFFVDVEASALAATRAAMLRSLLPWLPDGICSRILAHLDATGATGKGDGDG